MDFTTSPDPVCFLVDNGSLQPAATRGLRRIARELAARLGRPVEPVSLLHSDRVSPADLNGVAAEVFVAAIRRRHATGARRFVIVPLFFGQSAALTDYLPEKTAELGHELGSLEVQVTAPVAGSDAELPDGRVAGILAAHVRQIVHQHRLAMPLVVLVDHGSPQRGVTAVRDRIAQQLAATLGREARQVIAASMERRADAAYDFNEPLLERALTAPPCGSGAGDVVVAPLFFLPGRHAGPGGDIETIARAAEASQPGVRVHFAPLVGEHPGLLDVLADRYRAAVSPQE